MSDPKDDLQTLRDIADWQIHGSDKRFLKKMADRLEAQAKLINTAPTFHMGQRVTKRRGSRWTGPVCGIYATTLTPEGYAVESENEPGNVQIYPVAALVLAPEP